MVKITALMVLKDTPQGSGPVILATATDLGNFGFFQRLALRNSSFSSVGPSLNGPRRGSANPSSMKDLAEADKLLKDSKRVR